VLPTAFQGSRRLDAIAVISRFVPRRTEIFQATETAVRSSSRSSEATLNPSNSREGKRMKREGKVGEGKGREAKEGSGEGGKKREGIGPPTFSNLPPLTHLTVHWVH
jgi:hypothetical protein